MSSHYRWTTVRQPRKGKRARSGPAGTLARRRNQLCRRTSDKGSERRGKVALSGGRPLPAEDQQSLGEGQTAKRTIREAVVQSFEASSLTSSVG